MLRSKERGLIIIIIIIIIIIMQAINEAYLIDTLLPKSTNSKHHRTEA
jgi:hypothetical protein